jgi:hypothetical protein
MDTGLPLRCAVCLEDFAEGNTMRLLNCKHRFHKHCIDQWLHRVATCPICQRDCR